MDQTDRHRLPYLAGDQAQKHVTVNESVRMLDALVGAGARSADVKQEPAAPAPGDGYILPPGASGPAWDGFDAHDYVVRQDGAWARFAPSVGLSVFVADEEVTRVWDGATWRAQAGGGAAPDVVPSLGINAGADATNRLAVKSDVVLHSHDDVTPGTGDARHVVNKAAPGNTASFVFQTNYGGRAEIGLTGSDDFAFKVSPDGVTWHTALLIDRQTGVVTLPSTPDAQGPVHEVWVVVGQSNAIGRAANPGLSHPGETYQFDQSGALVPAATPLDHVGAVAGNIGLDVGFARAWHAQRSGTLTLVPCAVGGTGFSDNRWHPGDDLYTAAVGRADAALVAVRAARGDARLGGFLFVQGETDANVLNGPSYEQALGAMIGALRRDVAEATEATPFVLGRMTPDFVASGPGPQAIDAAHTVIARDTPYAAIIDSNELSGQANDPVHYDAASLDALGERLHGVVSAARDAAPRAPGAVAGVTATPGEETVSLTFDPAASNRSAITDYEVTVDGSPVSLPLSTAEARTITGLTGGRAYAFAVRAVNAVGAGPWSVAVNATPTAKQAAPGRLGLWVLGGDNPQNEEAGGGRALSLRQDAPVQAPGHVALAATNANALLSDLAEPAAYTTWCVFRRKDAGNQIVLGTLSGADGVGAFLASTSLYVNARGNPAANVNVGPAPAAGDWGFAAFSLAEDGRYLYYVGDAGGAITAGGAGTRTAPGTPRLIGVGNAYYAGGFAAALDVAEFGVAEGYADTAALDALYAEASQRQAARGNTLA